MQIYEDNESNRKEIIGKKLMESSKRIEFDIFFGFVNLNKGKYAIFIRKSEFVGFLMMKQSVWRATEFDIRRIDSGNDTNENKDTSDESFLYLLQKMFKTKSFYFSHYYDLTNNLQTFISQNSLTPNSRFFVNEGKQIIFRIFEIYNFQLSGGHGNRQFLVANSIDYGSCSRNSFI
jgi:hypothetical protein